MKCEKQNKKDVPKLACPNCALDLIPAQERGRYDADGNYISHLDDCRCRWCQWMWFDDVEPVTCECGVRVRISVDDACAYAEMVNR